MVEVLHLLLPAAGDLQDNLPHPGQQEFHQALGPAFQRLRKDRVVGVGHGSRGDVPRLIPVHAGVVDQDPHQLRDHQGRVGVVDLDDVLLMEVLHGTVQFGVLGGDGLEGGGHEEVLLFQPQRLALQMIVLRIEDLGNGLCHGLVLRGLQVLAPGEQGHIHRLGGPGVPQPQDIHMLRAVAGDLHVAGHGLDHLTVEGELGVLAGVEDEVCAEHHTYTNPEEVIDFATRTGCDSLAISIGTSHGAYKFKPEQCHVDPATGRLVPPPLAFEVLDAVMEKLPGFPIVLHGSSSVPQDEVDTINKYGGKLEAAIGIPEEELRKAAKSAVCKINIDSDSRLAMTAAVRKVFAEKPAEFDPRKYLGPARDNMEKLYKHKILNVLGSDNKLANC